MTRKQDIARTRAFGESVNFGLTASDYKRHRAGFPQKFFDSLVARGWVKPGQQSLDIGTGTGTVARGLAKLGASVIATDPATELLEQAVQLDRDENVEVEYRAGRAESIDSPNDTFDLVTAGQCWHWFDGAAAAAEVARVLLPGGRIVIAHFDWLPLPGNLVEATEELILKYNPDWTLSGGTGFYPQWLQHLAGAGFVELETYSFDLDQPYTPESWRGRIRASAGVQASLETEAIERFDAELSRILAERFPGDILPIPHRVWVASGLQ